MKLVHIEIILPLDLRRFHLHIVEWNRTHYTLRCIHLNGIEIENDCTHWMSFSRASRWLGIEIELKCYVALDKYKS